MAPLATTENWDSRLRELKGLLPGSAKLTEKAEAEAGEEAKSFATREGLEAMDREWAEKFEEALEALRAREGRIRKRRQQEESGLESDKDALSTCRQRVEKLHLENAEASERLNQLREALKAEDAEMDALGCEAQQTDEEERKKFPLLCAKKEALYRITRTVWEKTRKDSSLEGYVVNVAKNDLHWFRTERGLGADDNATRNLVWEFIAAGVGAKWKRSLQQ